MMEIGIYTFLRRFTTYANKSTQEPPNVSLPLENLALLQMNKKGIFPSAQETEMGISFIDVSA